MTKKFYIIAIMTSLTAGLGWAQNQTSDDLDLGLDPVYTEKLEVESNSQVPVQKSGSKQIQVENNQTLNPKKNETHSQPIYILNQSNPTASNQAQLQNQTQAQVQAAQVQKQPTTYIEAAPVVDSKAEKLRKARQDSEVQTEQKIVEKLETSRLDDEKKRADVLFGDRFNQLNNQNQADSLSNQQQAIKSQVVPMQVAPVQQPQVVTAPVVVVPEDSAVEELRISKKAKEIVRDTSVEDDSKTYFVGMLGVSEFNKVTNVQGVLATGFGLGVEYKAHLLVEADFIYSQFQRNFPITTNIDQYTFMGQLKYQILKGLVRPIVGGALSYSYRTFDDINPYNAHYYNSNSKITSNTLDSGLVVGVDVAPSENFSVGLDYRYMWNLTNKTNGYYQSFTNDQVPIDSLTYYVLSLNGRFTF